jgi:MoaA/NifB/PqqE/SkfB family radical SAM enzyme
MKLPFITKKEKLPIDAVVAVTYKCNARCTMCDIWKIREHNDVDLEVYKKLPRSMRFINVSGGEPFLRHDIVDIVRTLHETCPKAQMVISSNGFRTEEIVERMKKIHAFAGDKVGIGLSIDGMQEMHDKIRRIPDGFNKIMRTLDGLQEAGITNIRIAFTISGENIIDLIPLYELAREKGVQFTIAYAQSSDFYFGGKQNQFQVDPAEFSKAMNYLIRAELGSWNPKRWLRAFFTFGIYKFAELNKQPLPVVSGIEHFFLDPNGDIYPSVVHNMIMGNIRGDKSFEDVWFGKRAQKIRDKIRESSKAVWMICTARTAMLSRPGQVISWIMRNKFGKHEDIIG